MILSSVVGSWFSAIQLVKNVDLGSLTLIMAGSALMMAGSALVEMFGGIILRFTRNVAENDNPNEVEFGLKTFGFNPLERRA